MSSLLDEWAGTPPWLVCDVCGKGRVELRRNLLYWIALCNLSPGCPGRLVEAATMPAIQRKRP